MYYVLCTRLLHLYIILYSVSGSRNFQLVGEILKTKKKQEKNLEILNTNKRLFIYLIIVEI